MKLTLGELAQRVGGELRGDANLEIHGAATIRDVAPGQLTFINKWRLLKQLAKGSAAAVLVPPDIEPEGIPFVIVEDVQAAFTQIVGLFNPRRLRTEMGISPLAVVSDTARIGAGVEIHPGATVGDEVEIGDGAVIHSGVRLGAGCRIGKDAQIFPNAVLYEETVVGERTVIHAGAVIGAWGFGYYSDSSGHRLSPQLGFVTIGNDVEIGACATIDRGTYGPTQIGDGTKIDNLVMIAHNCNIGPHNLICAQVGLAGSCTTGRFVIMAGQVGVRDHIEVGDQATLAAKAGVMGNVKPKVTVVGIPATDVRDQMNKQAALARIPEVRKQVKELDRTVRELRAKIAALEAAQAERSGGEWPVAAADKEAA